MKKFLTLFISLLTVGVMLTGKSYACTNFIVTRGASVDGSVMVSYSADSHTRYGAINFAPSVNYTAASQLKVFDYEKGGLRGEIPQIIGTTYSALGHTNCHQLVIGETTFGGRKELVNPEGILDYGSLIYITLQRASTAREAILLMDELMQEYGYGSSGESFSVADKNEAWIMEIVGKGEGVKGSVWVARRVPDGYISGHANQARITTFPLDDPENTLYAKDVISFAREKGYFKGEDKDFNFTAAYAPIDFGGARYCEARVWSFFNMYNKESAKYVDYAMGHNLKNVMPLWVKPDRKLSVADVARAMRDHYEGTPMDMTTDIGAGGEECPYRWRPMSFEVDGKTYLNERATATQQTGFWFITQSRNWLPDAIGGVNWFGVDDAATSCLIPLYMSSTKVSKHIRLGNGNMLTYSPTSLFWLTNRIAQFAYLRYNVVGKAVQERAAEFEATCYAEQVEVDKKAAELYEVSPTQAVDYLTKYSVRKTAELFTAWQELDIYLLVKYIDGNNKKEENGEFLNNGQSENVPTPPENSGYSDKWKRAIVKDNGKTLRVSKN